MRIGPPVDAGLERDIENSIDVFPAGQLNRLVEDSRSGPHELPYIIKFSPTANGAVYRAAGMRLRVSNTPGFTWGTGSYVTPLAFPLSPAIYGRAGIVAQFDPTDWRVFDATDPGHRSLYLRWALVQPAAQYAFLTAHSGFYNQVLRNIFRRHFRIDCVLFHPDQRARTYTRLTDIWMLVTDWEGSDIAKNSSHRLQNPRLAVVVEEEFKDSLFGILKKPLLALSTDRPDDLQVRDKVIAAYKSGDIVRITA
jgi:hypothetical protein